MPRLSRWIPDTPDPFDPPANEATSSRSFWDRRSDYLRAEFCGSRFDDGGSTVAGGPFMRSDSAAVEETRQIRSMAHAAALEVIKILRESPLLMPEWLSLRDAAVYCGYSDQQFSEFVRTKRAPKSVKFSNNARRFKRSDLDTWCAAGGPSQFKPHQ